MDGCLHPGGLWEICMTCHLRLLDLQGARVRASVCVTATGKAGKREGNGVIEGKRQRGGGGG